MYKGKYTALIEIDIHVPDEVCEIRPFDVAMDDLRYFADEIKDIIQGEIDEECGTVKVTTWGCDLWEVDGDE